MSLGFFSLKINTRGFSTESGMQTVLLPLVVSAQGSQGWGKSVKSQLLESFDYESHYIVFFFFSKVQTFNFRGKKKNTLKIFSAKKVFSAKKGKINKKKPQIQYSIKNAWLVKQAYGFGNLIVINWMLSGSSTGQNRKQLQVVTEGSSTTSIPVNSSYRPSPASAVRCCWLPASHPCLRCKVSLFDWWELTTCTSGCTVRCKGCDPRVAYTCWVNSLQFFFIFFFFFVERM